MSYCEKGGVLFEKKHSDEEEKELCMKVKTASEIISKVGA